MFNARVTFWAARIARFIPLRGGIRSDIPKLRADTGYGKSSSD